MILFENIIRYCTGRCRQRLRSVPSFLLTGIAELYIGARSVLSTRGWGWDRSPSALRNSRLAASASRNPDSKKSMVAPAESMARYKFSGLGQLIVDSPGRSSLGQCASLAGLVLFKASISRRQHVSVCCDPHIECRQQEDTHDKVGD